MNRRSYFPSLIIKLGFISLLTDLSSEMIFPLLPVFIMTLPGGGPLAIGIIEGIAESTASFLKLISGLLTDRARVRTPFVKTGYILSSIVRPFIAAAMSVHAVLILRFLDRVGKGLRSSPRDALIADTVPAHNRGKAYGFQRIMDHAGAVAGPLVAAALLVVTNSSIRHVFIVSAIPAAAVIVIVMTLREPAVQTQAREFSEVQSGSKLTSGYRLFLVALFVFTLGNSTDAFLLLRLSEAGMKPAAIAGLWSLHHVLKISGAWIGGQCSDRFGRKPLMLIGFGLYAVIYLLFGIFSSLTALTCTFIVYGAAIGIIEPSQRAWVSELASPEKRGAAFGYMHAVTGLGALPASVLFGLLWRQFGQAEAFFTGAALAFAAMAITAAVRQYKAPTSYCIP